MTEPRKTPRTDAAELPWVANTQVACYGPCVKADFARALEIETQELAEALMGVVTMLEAWHSDMPEQVGDKEPAVLAAAHAALARHRAKQEVKS